MGQVCDNREREEDVEQIKSRVPRICSDSIVAGVRAWLGVARMRQHPPQNGQEKPKEKARQNAR